MLAAVPAAIATLLFAAAPAPGARWGLRWVAPAECIQPGAMSRAVESRLGRPVFGPEPDFMLDGELFASTEPPRWRARIALVDARGTLLGTRDVSSDDEACASIDASLALVMAVMIDPAAALGSTPQPAAPVAAAPAPSPDPDKEPPPPPVIQRKPLPPTRMATQDPPSRLPPDPPRSPAGAAFHLGVTGNVGAGLAPTAGPFFALWLGEFPGWPVELQGFALAPSVLERGGGRAIVTGVGLGVTTCPLMIARGPWQFDGCAGASAHGQWSYSQGFQQSLFAIGFRPELVARARVRRQWLPFSGASLGLNFGWALSRPGLRLLKTNGTSELLDIGAPWSFGVDLAWAFGGTG